MRQFVGFEFLPSVHVFDIPYKGLILQSPPPPRPTSDRSATAVPLLTLAPGTVATLRRVLDPESRTVLRSLGLTDGAVLRICRVGDPCIIQVRSTRIGLSRVVAQSVYVAVAEEGAS